MRTARIRPGRTRIIITPIPIRMRIHTGTHIRMPMGIPTRIRTGIRIGIRMWRTNRPSWNSNRAGTST